MRKELILLMTTLLIWMANGVQAQVIQRGNKFYDGAALYTVSSIGQDGVVTMKGNDPWGGSYVLKLKKKPAAGRYELMPSGDFSPFRCKWGAEVQYVRQNGMNFLAVKNSKGQVVETLTLTPDNLQNCTGQQEQMAEFMALEGLNEAVSSFLMNTHITVGSSLEDLQAVAIRVSGLARPSIIEKTNLDLLFSEIAYRDGDAEGGYDNPDGLGADGRGADEIEDDAHIAAGRTKRKSVTGGAPNGTVIQYDGEQYIRVTTAEQFLHSIISGINVLVAKDTEINLTPLLDDSKWWERQTYIYKWVSEGNAPKGVGQAIVSEEVFDGRQLTICNYKQIIIRGEGNSSIVVEPRYAFCLNFKNCEQIEIRNLTIGHTEGGYCEGGVIGVDGGWRISLQHCDLYGCGTYGLQLQNTRDFSMYDSNIHDCTYGIMTLDNVEFAKFDGCDFFRNREFSLIDSRGSALTFYKCRFYANHADSPLFHLDNEFFLSGCEIYHPTENLGTIDLADQSGDPNKFSPNPLESGIKPRNTGPDK